MNWLIRSQHRGQALWAVIFVAMLCALMVAVGLHVGQGLAPYDHWITALRAAGCPLPGSDKAPPPGPAARTCDALNQQLQNFQSNFAPRYNFAIPAFVYGVPLALIVMGTLVGAPLVAREIEQRTQLVAWTQSVSRWRWYRAKTLTVFAGLAVISLIAGFANSWLQGLLIEGGLASSRLSWFFSNGVTVTGETLLAFALAVAAGTWLRRSLAAVGAALVGSVVLLVMTGLAVRTFTPARQTKGPHFVAPPDAWYVQSPNGHSVPYHPISQYWPLQLTFLAIILALAAALLASGWYATRSRAV